MNYVYLGLFVVITGLHLYGSLKNDRLFRAATKGMILLVILGFYLESVDNPSGFLVAALLTSWAGDMLLIPKEKKFFVVGGISFMISHALFIASYCEIIDFSKVPIWCFIVFAAVFSAAVAVIFSKLKQYLSKSLVAPMFAYLLINGAMNCFAIFRLVSSLNLAGCGPLITAIGAVLFFISDSSLFFVRFNENSKMKSHFLVMLTYSLGEFLIVLGMVL